MDTDKHTEEEAAEVDEQVIKVKFNEDDAEVDEQAIKVKFNEDESDVDEQGKFASDAGLKQRIASMTDALAALS